MIRTHLLGAVSAAALACVSTASFATTSLPTVVFGGSSLIAQDLNGVTVGSTSIPGELPTFNTKYSASTTVSKFGNYSSTTPYYTQGSGAGREAVLYNNILCLINGASGNPAACGLASGNTIPTAAAGGTNVVHMAASDAVLTAAEWAIWTGTGSTGGSSTTNYGIKTAGNLIQVPSVGVGIAIPVNLTANGITKNGQLSLTDAQICSIFSGKTTDWGQISSTLGNGSNNPITVVYRGDSSGTSAIFTAHLAQVCDATNSNFEGGSATAGDGLSNTSVWSVSSYTFGAGKFTSLFGGSSPMPSKGFVSESGSGPLSAYIAATPGAIGYVSPDYTTLTTTGKAVNPTLLVAAVKGVNETAATTPVAANIILGLDNAGTYGGVSSAQFTSPPTSATQAAEQDVWTPIIPVVSKGYPIVGYTTFIFPQCFADKTVATSVIDFLNLHYANAAYKKIETTDNGFVGLGTTTAGKIVPILEDRILKNAGAAPLWNYNINNTTTCKGLGR